jgi:WD40 repeat protein
MIDGLSSSISGRRLYDLNAESASHQPLDLAGGYAIFSPEGKRLLTGPTNNEFLIWTIEESTPVSKQVLEQCGDFVHSIEFSADAQTVVAASTDGTIRT